MRRTANYFMPSEINTFKCAMCKKDCVSLIKSKVMFHEFDGDLHIVLSRGQNIPQDHVVPTCQGCVIPVLRGLLNIEIDEMLGLLQAFETP
jgi:hypothetical protein